jgi:hypothetical protein
LASAEVLRAARPVSDANVQDFALDADGRLLQLSVTTLPNLFRFKAGGSRSVRGYDFESLSNNGIGSNNIVTASAEIEMKFRRDWSLAAFFDAGNAFNDWSDFELLKGAGRHPGKHRRRHPARRRPRPGPRRGALARAFHDRDAPAVIRRRIALLFRRDC